MTGPRGDEGNALIEFVFLGVLLMVPLMYIMLNVFDAQRAAFGVTEAARQAGRTFVVSGCDPDRATTAARMAMEDQGLDLQGTPGGLSGLACPDPGGSAAVQVRHFVQLRGLGALVPVDRGGFWVTGRFVAVRDRFQPSAGPPVDGSPS